MGLKYILHHNSVQFIGYNKNISFYNFSSTSSTIIPLKPPPNQSQQPLPRTKTKSPRPATRHPVRPSSAPPKSPVAQATRAAPARAPPSRSIGCARTAPTAHFRRVTAKMAPAPPTAAAPPKRKKHPRLPHPRAAPRRPRAPPDGAARGPGAGRAPAAFYYRGRRVYFWPRWGGATGAGPRCQRTRASVRWLTAVLTVEGSGEVLRVAVHSLLACALT